MEKTQKQAEKAAKKATQEILKEVISLRKTLDFDQIHVLKKSTRKAAQNKIIRITNSHIRDCYLSSWLCEAELLEDLFGDQLLRGFLSEYYGIQAQGGRRYLLGLVREYSAPYNPDPVKNRQAQLKAVNQIPQDLPGRKVAIKAVKYTYNMDLPGRIVGNLDRYDEWLKDVGVAPKQDRPQLVKWRTGEHGESGLGYAETTLLRTESDTAQAEACIDAYKEAGVPRYRFNAMKDDKTCAVCKALDGKIFDLEKKEPGTNFPPIHPNCRCYIEPIM